ncbi:glycosyltransferase involved in cell wall biosynthesis [Sinomonas atrocyanea]|nr:glycosyltransferase involved in cell wall biosynthesis [Sinomonas atrocyanea]
MRIGILYPVPDPISPKNWSGTPAGLASGFAAIGHEVVPLGARIMPGLHQLVAVLSRSTGRRGAVADRLQVRRWARTNALARRLDVEGPLDGLVAMGTEMYDLARVVRGRVPAVTYDDATLLQMYRHPNSDISRSRFPDAHVQRWVRRQQESTRSAELCCVSTEWAARSFRDDYGIPHSRIAVVGMGHFSAARPDLRRDWSSPKFLFVGVDWRRKNGDRVLAAFERLRRVIPNAHLDLVGHHPSLNMPGVHGHGFLPREDPRAQAVLARLFAEATCFVLPSEFDPSPIAYLEAASAGLPVIATSEGGAAELLGPGALVVDPTDTDALVAAMLELAKPEIAVSVGRAASESASTSSWPHVAARISNALADLRGTLDTDEVTTW